MVLALLLWTFESNEEYSSQKNYKFCCDRKEECAMKEESGVKGEKKSS